MSQSVNLEDNVRSVIRDFIKDSVLFTALDVSNKVKEILPLARHREVRDVVRNLWLNEIEASGYARSPIKVTLSDGTTAEAILYHPLVDSWDLDAKYDAQKRAQTAARPNTSQVTISVGNQTASIDPNGMVIVTDGSITLGSDKTVTVVSNPSQTPIPVQTQQPSVQSQSMTARDLWEQMFKTQPSLFPRK